MVERHLEEVSIRPMTPEDIDMFVRFVNEPTVSPFWYGKEITVTRESLLADWKMYYFDGSRPDKGRCFVIEAGFNPIGVVSYTDTSYNIEGRRVSAEIDVAIGEPDYQDRGLGTAAIRLFLGYLFNELGFHRVHGGTYAHNRRMQRCLENVGFTLEGVSRESDWVDGRYVDTFCYGILAGEFEG